MNFVSGWTTEIYVRILMLWNKNESSLETLQRHIFQATESSVWKWKVYCRNVVIQNSTIRGYHVLHVRTNEILKMLILMTRFLLPAKVILQYCYIRLKVHYWSSKKIHERVKWFLEWWSYVKSHSISSFLSIRPVKLKM